MSRLLRVLLIALAAAITLIILLNHCPHAHANPGNFGPGPAPGLCDYPAVCDAGQAGGVVDIYWYREDWPVELNGSHRHCYYYGAATQGNIQLGFSMMLSISAGATGPVGGLAGGCHYVCPDGELAAIPNPPGGFKDAIIPTRCKPIGPNPDMPVPISTPIAEQGAVPAIPFVPPLPQPEPPPGVLPPLPPPPPEPAATAPDPIIPPVVTNPEFPNPLSTNNTGQ